jgi:hypothetical protein
MTQRRLRHAQAAAAVAAPPTAPDDAGGEEPPPDDEVLRELGAFDEPSAEPRG